MAFCLSPQPASAGRSFVRRRHSSITKWAAQIFRERFDLESPNFIRESILTHSTATPNMTSPTTSCQKLMWKKCLTSQERFKWGSPHFAHLSGTICLTNLLDMTALAASNQLQNAIKYYTKVCKTFPADKESNNSAIVYPRSSNFTWTSMLT